MPVPRNLHIIDRPRHARCGSTSCLLQISRPGMSKQSCNTMERIPRPVLPLRLERPTSSQMEVLLPAGAAAPVFFRQSAQSAASPHQHGSDAAFHGGRQPAGCCSRDAARFPASLYLPLSVLLHPSQGDAPPPPPPPPPPPRGGAVSTVLTPSQSCFSPSDFFSCQSARLSRSQCALPPHLVCFACIIEDGASCKSRS